MIRANMVREFELWVHDYCLWRDLRRCAEELVGSDAEDLVQETVIRIMRRFRDIARLNLKQHEKFFYCRRIMRNIAFAEKRRRRLVLHLVDPLDLPFMESHVDRSFEQVDALDFLECVSKGLPPALERCLEVFLRNAGDREKMAEEMERSEHSVRRELQRLVAWLQDHRGDILGGTWPEHS